MKIRVSQDLERIDYLAVDAEVPKVAQDSIEQELLAHSFDNPVLLVDTSRNAQLPSIKRDLMARLLEFPVRTFEYDDTLIEWSELKYPSVWSPSIDTILFAKALKQVFIDLKVLDSFLEIGCGSGFLSKYTLELAKRNGRDIRFAELMDINQDALNSAQNSIKETDSTTEIVYTLNIPNAPLSSPKMFDLIICNPPYVARPNPKNNNPFEGLFLYEEILSKAKKLLNPQGRLVLNFSSISKKGIYPEYEKIFDIETLTSLKVPLKIPVITAGLSPASREWIKYLESNNNVIVDPEEKSGYRYWQVIEIALCKFKASAPDLTI